MSCLSLMKIKPSLKDNPSRQYVPCGKCPDCLQKSKFSWEFRLRAEWSGLCKQKNITWRCAFVTLTYGTPKGGYPRDMRPIIHRRLFKNPKDFSKENPIYCFDRSHVRNLFDNLKVWLHDKFNITKETRCRFLCASEYGEWTHRPHYHAVIFYPLINGLTDHLIFDFIKTFWENRHGMIFPQTLNGGNRNKKGMIEKPFNVENVENNVGKCLAYVSKYICKDLEFTRLTRQDTLRTDSKLFRRYDSFHLQSKSLGASVLSNLTDDECLRLYRDGLAFAGDEKKRPLPVYLKNKLIFDNVYIYTLDGGELKRLVRKRANAFFNEYYEEIYNLKVNHLVETFKNALTDLPVTVQEVARKNDVQKYAQYIQTEKDIRFVCSWYVSYYGRPLSSCVECPFADAYRSKYDWDFIGVYKIGLLYDESYVRFMNELCDFMFMCLRESGIDTSFDEYKQYTDAIIHLGKEDLTNV